MDLGVPMNSKEVRSTHKGFHILLIDPDKLALNYTTDVLQQFFYKVTATEAQTWGLGLLASNTELYDLIMMDEKPQQMDYQTFITRVKKISLNIPVVLLTSRDEADVSTEAKRYGASHVITKPVCDIQVKFLRKYAAEWRVPIHEKVLKDAKERKRRESLYREKAKQGVPLASVGKIKAVSFGNNDGSVYGSKDSNKRRLSDRFYGEHFDCPDKRGKSILDLLDPGECNEDKENEETDSHVKSKSVYTEIHKRYMKILGPKSDPEDSSKGPHLSTSLIMHQFLKFKGKTRTGLTVQMPGASSLNPILLDSDGGSSSHHLRNLNLGVPGNGVLGSPSFGGITLTTFLGRGSAKNSFKNVVTDETIQLSYSSYSICNKNNAMTSSFGVNITERNIGLNRFSQIAENCSSQVGAAPSLVDYGSKTTLLDSSSSSYPMHINNLLNSTTTGLLTQASNSSLGRESPSIYRLGQTETDCGIEGLFQEPSYLAAVTDDDNDVSRWLQSLDPQDENNSFTDDIIEISIDELLEDPDKLEESRSSSSAYISEGLETNPDHPNSSSSNDESVTKINIDETVEEPDKLKESSSSPVGSMNTEPLSEENSSSPGSSSA